jgi:hypothetical protein
MFVQLCSLLLILNYNIVNAGNNQYSLHNKIDKKSRDMNDVLVSNELQIVNPTTIKVSSSSLRYFLGEYTPPILNYSNNQLHDIYNVTPSTPIKNDDIVTIFYKTDTPQLKDWIGAYSPANVDITKTSPVKWQYCDEWNPGYYDNTTQWYGMGNLTFNFTNLRSDIRFVYFTNNIYEPIAMNVSNFNVSFENINQPLRPRVTASGDVDILNFAWGSAYSTSPKLKWGTSSGSYPNVIDAVNSQINREDLCGAPANETGWRDFGLIHTTQFIGMKDLANQDIYYIFGDEETSDYSDEHKLHVPPLPGTQPPTRPTTVILFDDLGRGSFDDAATWDEYGAPSILTAESIASRVSTGDIDMIYHGGDISYATGYAAVWDFFLDMVSPMTSGVTYLTTVGNHESDWWYNSYYKTYDSGGECGVVATTLLTMPNRTSLDGKSEKCPTNEPWWSYDVGLIHFVGMSTEHNYTEGSPQWRWLKNDLETVNRTATPWVIFGGHRAMYLNSYYGIDEAESGNPNDTSDYTVMNLMIKSLEPMLWANRVNIGFYGHNHCVQRQSAVYNKTVVQKSTEKYNENGEPVYWHENPQATVHMVVGTGGADFTFNAIWPDSYLFEFPEWNEVTFTKHGYAVVQAVNESYLTWDYIGSADDTVLDRMVITQDLSQPTWVLPTTDDSSSNVNSFTLTGLQIGLIVFGCIIILAVVGRYFYATKEESVSISRKNSGGSVQLRLSDPHIKNPMDGDN